MGGMDAVGCGWVVVVVAAALVVVCGSVGETHRQPAAPPARAMERSLDPCLSLLWLFTPFLLSAPPTAPAYGDSRTAATLFF